MAFGERALLIAAAVQDAGNQNAAAFVAVVDDVVANREAPHTRRDVFTQASCFGVTRQQREPLDDPVDQRSAVSTLAS